MVTELNRKTIWGWMSYDWASQPHSTLLVTFIFAPYFTSTVVGDPVQGQAQWGYMTGIAGLLIALSAPILGVFADFTGLRKRLISIFSVMYIIGSVSLWYAVPEMQSTTGILLLFAVGLIGNELLHLFASSFLPDIAPRSEMGRISGAGWGFGYAGGVFALIVMMAFFAQGGDGLTYLGFEPAFGLNAAEFEGTRFVGPLTALWFIVFIAPFFLFVPEIQKPYEQGQFRLALTELWKTIKGLPQRTSFFAYLGSSMFYRDALNGMYAFGGIYAAGVLKWEITQIGIFGIIAAIAGAIACWLGGYADQRFGPKRVIVWCVVILMITAILIITTSRTSFLFMPLSEGSSLPDQMFYIYGMLIGSAGGVLQATSRTMLVDQVEPDRVTEGFGLYGLAGKATAFIAPLSIAVVTDITGNQQLGVTPIIVLFVIGLVILKWVKSNEAYA
ncbi:MAG: MFS transporter [Pseudomonadota bacterium]